MKTPMIPFFISLLWLTLSAFAGEEVIKDKQGMDCHVYTPADVDKSKTYWLVVGVHGANGKGKGAAGMAGWAQRGDVIVIGPSFQNGYQNGNAEHASKLIALFNDLKKKYTLHDKMFLYGFSGGSQFTHRFAMNHPKYVCGVSAHSGGSWATSDGRYGKISATAKSIPFAISCGEKDTGKAWGAAPMNRLDWYRTFQEAIDKKGFTYIGNVWPGVGHKASKGSWDYTKQCFQLATSLPGESATEKVEISADWKNLNKLPNPPKSKKTEKRVKKLSPRDITKTIIPAFKAADKQNISNSKLCKFMAQYPPVLWKDMDGSAKLLEQCERAATAWVESAKKHKQWNSNNKKKFQNFAEGLAIHKETFSE